MVLYSYHLHLHSSHLTASSVLLLSLWYNFHNPSNSQHEGEKKGLASRPDVQYELHRGFFGALANQNFDLASFTLGF